MIQYRTEPRNRYTKKKMISILYMTRNVRSICMAIVCGYNSDVKKIQFKMLPLKML